MSKILFPRPFAFAIDDLGWNSGSDLSEQPAPGPYRTGVKRVFDLKDYQHIVAVGEAVGARVQCLFILSEMDRENILARFPTTTYQRDQWNNSFRVNEDQKIIMQYVSQAAAYMEFGLHGTGHEYWAPGQPQKRAEWYNLNDKAPWPEQSLREHIQCFKDIMAQYGFTKANGHSFPESFVPCAYSYYWNPQGAYSLGKLLTEAGVKYANTDFSMIPELNPPAEPNGGGFDYGTHVINRMNYGNVWYELNSLPKVPVDQQETDIIESHWPNWLAQDDPLQPPVTAAWIQYYKNIQRRPDRYIAKNTAQLHAQWLYKKYTMVTEETPGQVTIDNTAMPDEAYYNQAIGNLVLKIALTPGQHIAEATLNGRPIAAYLEDEGYGFLYLPVLQQEQYTLHYAVGTNTMPVYILHDGTYNVYNLTVTPTHLQADLKVYGEQVIRIKCNKPSMVTTTDNALQIQQFVYDEVLGEAHITTQATDMQGARAMMQVHF